MGGGTGQGNTTGSEGCCCCLPNEPSLSLPLLSLSLQSPARLPHVLSLLRALLLHPLSFSLLIVAAALDFIIPLDACPSLCIVKDMRKQLMLLFKQPPST